MDYPAYQLWTMQLTTWANKVPQSSPPSTKVLLHISACPLNDSKFCAHLFKKNGPIPTSFSFIFVFSNKYYNFYNKYV